MYFNMTLIILHIFNIYFIGVRDSNNNSKAGIEISKHLIYKENAKL